MISIYVTPDFLLRVLGIVSIVFIAISIIRKV